MVRTIFKAILKFSKQHIICTDAIRHLTKTIDRHNGRLAFKTWCADTRHKRESHLFSTEKDVVASLDTLVDGLGALQDRFHKTNQTKERLITILKLEGKEIMKKWFIRFHYGGI